MDRKEILENYYGEWNEDDRFMISGAMRELLLTMSDEEFIYYTEYIYSICERADMIGMSGHLLDIYEKK